MLWHTNPHRPWSSLYRVAVRMVHLRLCNAWKARDVGVLTFKASRYRTPQRPLASRVIVDDTHERMCDAHRPATRIAIVPYAANPICMYLIEIWYRFLVASIEDTVTIAIWMKIIRIGCWIGNSWHSIEMWIIFWRALSIMSSADLLGRWDWRESFKGKEFCVYNRLLHDYRLWGRKNVQKILQKTCTVMKMGTNCCHR